MEFLEIPYTVCVVMAVRARVGVVSGLRIQEHMDATVGT